MNIFYMRSLIFCAATFVSLPSLLWADDATRPNLIFIFADDWGYGDLSAMGNLSDVKTPHLDALSQQGVMFTDAYITAPQCSPSRAGLMTGRYQQRFGFDTIPDGPLPLDQLTVAERLREVGYATGMVGKWHLEPNAVCLKWAKQHQPDGIQGNRVLVRRDLSMPYWPQSRGFDEFFQGELNPYWANFDLRGKTLNPTGETVHDGRFRVDVQTDAGLAFIRRNADKSFFLYLAHYAPHVPLEASEKYLQRFLGDMPERRRTGLAMINAVDEGVGRIMKLLQDKGIADNTFVMFASDNGAPLGAHTGELMADILPVGKPGPAWDGSRNDPLRGEKGMVAEGGIRVPMIWSWPAKLPKGKIISEPVISLDMTVSALAAAGVNADSTSSLDGVDLVPWLSGIESQKPQRDLYWRFWNQGAVRDGDWKYILTGDGRELLFNIRDDKEEQHNLINSRRGRAKILRDKLKSWTSELKPPGLPSAPLNVQEVGWYKYYFDEKVTATMSDVKSD
ncbi:sulfatase-like hydrolase/transferase [Novipirellula rosea]|uniref:Sulfatase N-terminal domain-containing protein n=1 Tax=Novipirellula rosea TaxID=1031540 RepID=A0ABP8MB20_9BACT